MRRYPIAPLVSYYLSRPPEPTVASEPHCIVDLEPVWTVRWIPDCGGGYTVATKLKLGVAEIFAGRYDTIARAKGWSGRAEVVLGTELKELK